MIVLLRRKTLWGILLVAAGCLLLIGSIAVQWKPAEKVFSAVKTKSPSSVLIWDAGHGGADGGAVSAKGVPEAGINLDIAKNGYLLCRFLGIPSTMTRWDENSLADDFSGIRQQKVSDTYNRVALINQHDSAVLISIHQNSLPDSVKTHGAMVFHNGIGAAESIAQNMQDTLNSTVNAGNEKQCRPISGDIYLMAHVHCSAILVECGFMSHAQEAELLQEKTYQLKLSCAILGGYLL